MHWLPETKVGDTSFHMRVGEQSSAFKVVNRSGGYCLILIL